MDLNVVASWTEEDAQNTLVRIFEDKLPQEAIIHIFNTLYAPGDSLKRLHMHRQVPIHPSLGTLGAERWKARWLEKYRVSFPFSLSLVDQRARCVIHNHLNRRIKYSRRLHSTKRVLFFEVPEGLRDLLQPLLPDGCNLRRCWIHATSRVSGNLYQRHVDENGNSSLQNAVFWDRPQVEKVVFDGVQLFPSESGYGLSLQATLVLVRERDA